MDEPAQAAEAPVMRPGGNGGGKLMPAWTREEAIEKARKGGLASKGRREVSIRGMVKRMVGKRSKEDPTRSNGSIVAEVLVTMAKAGDAFALKTVIEAVDGALAQASKTTVSESRSIVVRQREGDPVQLERTVTTTQESAIDEQGSDAHLP